MTKKKKIKRFKPGLLIFDFDGTIVDTKSLYYKNMLKNLKKYGYDRKEIDEAIDLGLKLKETLEKIGFSWLYRWWLNRRIMKDILKDVKGVKKCKDVSILRKINYEKILVTNSSPEIVNLILKDLNLESYFSEIYTADDFNTKEEFIENYLKDRKINRKKCMYLGDRVVDVRIGKNVNCLSVAVTSKCAWDSRKELVDAEPDIIIDDLKELKDILK